MPVAKFVQDKVNSFKLFTGEDTVPDYFPRILLCGINTLEMIDNPKYVVNGHTDTVRTENLQSLYIPLVPLNYGGKHMALSMIEIGEEESKYQETPSHLPFLSCLRVQCTSFKGKRICALYKTTKIKKSILREIKKNNITRAPHCQHA